MKIAILGTRGIPNNYGGFEQFAEYLSKGLVKSGHEAFVYNTHDHPYKENEWNGVKLIHKYNPESWMGTLGQFFYDLFCIIDCRKRKFDIILQLGYTSSSIWGKLLPKKSIIITNMDGLEWKRSKYSAKVQRFLKYAEKLATKTSNYLVADSLGIQEYLKDTYQLNSEYIPYGTHIFEHPDESFLEKFQVQVFSYNILIARMEPENNIEIILEGVAASFSDQPMLVIGRTDNTFGKYLLQKFAHVKKIRFIGSLYDMSALNNLRFFSHLYFHGHSVGGTNPSLLEAMGSGALICAHKNIFNEAILGKDAYYFASAGDITQLLNTGVEKEKKESIRSLNILKVKEKYLWPKIISSYEELFKKVSS